LFFGSIEVFIGCDLQPAKIIIMEITNIMDLMDMMLHFVNPPLEEGYPQGGMDYFCLIERTKRITDYNPLYTKCILGFHAPTEHLILAQG